MLKINFKKVVSFFMAASMLTVMLTPALMVGTVSAADATLDPWGGKQKEVKGGTGLGERDPREIAAMVINVVLGFLGIVAVVIILIGGFKWMTAGGNDDQVAEAKKWIFSGVIGLLIILASYALATFVLNQLMTATSDTTPKL